MADSNTASTTPEQRLEAADKLLYSWLEWFSMNPGKLQMAPSGMTRLHLAARPARPRNGESE